ncbi:MAG: hypothetical protein OXF86_07940, partial [Caldilineaceae bacterium]|nr:hypothetical protein [Caldilineaceae bacterium]
PRPEFGLSSQLTGEMQCTNPLAFGLNILTNFYIKVTLPCKEISPVHWAHWNWTEEIPDTLRSIRGEDDGD